MSDFEFRDDAEIKAVFKFEVGREQNDHNLLYNKSLPNQHPIEAITGLNVKINELNTHIADKTNPHEVTKAQVGLGNCDNTSDLDKPISTATQTALNSKQDSATAVTHTNSTAVGSATQPVYIASDGTATAITYSIGKSVPSDALFTDTLTYIGAYDSSVQYHAGDIVKYSNEFYEALQDNINTATSNTATWSQLSEDHKVRYYEQSDNVEYPIGLTGSGASGSGSNGYMNFTAQNKPTINASTGVITAPGGIIGKTETAGDNSTKVSTTAFVQTAISTKQDTLTFDSTPTQNSTNPVTSGGVYTALTGKADVATTLAGYGITDGANTALSNLSSDGQMVIDTQNGTISNCILEIPQNIKLELSGGVLTLKAGSVVTKTGSTYVTITTNTDKTVTISKDDIWVVFITNNGASINNYVRLNRIDSGNTLPTDDTDYQCFYNTTDKLIYFWNNNQWTKWNVCYPLCVVKVENGNMSFVKDSNGNDMIFNGAGFIGHHAFVYPNVSGLTPQKFNADGTLKSRLRTNTSLAIIEMNQGQYNGYNRVISLIAGNPVNNTAGYVEIENREEFVNVDWIRQYVKNENVIISKTSSGIIEYTGSLYPPQTPLLEYNYDGTTVTDFTIRQPVRTATTEMLDSATTKAKIYKGTYDATVQYYAGDIVKSGSVFYEALQDNINTATSNTANWSKLSNDQTVRYVERTDNVEYPIGMTSSNASGSGYGGYMYFTAQNKPTINASTGVITAPGGIIGKTETAGDNSTKYATTAFVNGYLASITGYDATKTQTLKNVSGTLTWVDD